MGNANADNLIERILADARESADSILAEADASCAQIARERDDQIAKIAFAQEKLRTAQIGEILDGAKTRARIDGRKELLAAKREVLDRAFEAAYSALSSRSQSDLCALYARVLDAEAEEGDLVMPAAADREAVSAAVSATKVSVRLSEENAKAERGFVLYGKSYEKDCSLGSILSELRGVEETKVAEVLFS